MGGKEIERRSVFHPYLAERIGYLREREGFTQVELEIAVGYKEKSGTISRIESGEIGINLNKVDIMSLLLKVEPETLAYPSPLNKEELDFIDKLHKVFKNKGKASNLNAIKALIEDDIVNIESD